MAPDGRFVTAWLAGSSVPSLISSIYVRPFAADGTPWPIIEVASQPAQDPPVNLSDIDAPSVAINDAGEFVVAWTSSVTRGRDRIGALGINTGTLFARRYAFDGSPLGETQVVAQRTFGAPGGTVNLIRSNARIAMNTDGGYAIGYVTEFGNQLVSPLNVRVYRADGRPAGLPMRVGLGGDREAFVSRSDFALSYVANGDLIFAWVTPDTVQRRGGRPETMETIWLARYTPLLGIQRGPAVQVATRAPLQSRTSLSLAPIPSGGVAITWADPMPGAPAVYGRYFAADESPLGDTFTIATGTDQINATTDAAGNLIATYGSVFLRRFQGP